MWTSRVHAVVSAQHSNGPEGQRCFKSHGHDWLVEVEIEYYEVDKWGWGPSFSAIKDIIRSYDHDSLNTLMSVPPSAENFAFLIHNRIWVEVIQPTIRQVHKDIMSVKVTVHEGEDNTVTYSG